MKTKERIEEVIEALDEQRGTLPEFSTFGDNNWIPLDAQLEILDWVLGDDEALERDMGII